jgi:DNA end-binding protein Ku
MPGKGGDKPYALLREAMREQDVVGIGKIIMRKHQHLAGIHVVGDALVLEIMRFANEVLDVSSLTFPKASVVDSKQKEMASQLVNSLSTTFEPEKYTDDYRANLMRIIKAKSKGKDVTLEMQEPGEPDAKVLDLMEMLKKSLANGKSSTRKSPAKSASRKTARKSPIKRAKSA